MMRSGVARRDERIALSASDEDVAQTIAMHVPDFDAADKETRPTEAMQRPRRTERLETRSSSS